MEHTFTLTYQTIDKYQLKDTELVEKIKYANYHFKPPGIRVYHNQLL